MSNEDLFWSEGAEVSAEDDPPLFARPTAEPPHKKPKLPKEVQAKLPEDAVQAVHGFAEDVDTIKHYDNARRFEKLKERVAAADGEDQNNDNGSNRIIETLFSLQNESQYAMHDQIAGEVTFDSCPTVLIDGQSASLYAQSLIAAVHDNQVPLQTHVRSKWAITDESPNQRFVLIDLSLWTFFADPAAAINEQFSATEDDHVRFAHILEALPAKK